MDDHDLGALLDTSVPAQPASEAALTRIHRRAAQRVRRIRFAAAAFTIVLIAAGGATAAALSGTSNAIHLVPPADSTSTAPHRPKGRLIVGGGPCARGSITLAIQIVPAARSNAKPDTQTWIVTATARTKARCRVHSSLDAAIETPDGVLRADLRMALGETAE